MTPNQADRDAAADWCEAQPFPSKQAEAPAIRAGEYDHHSLVQAFAAHRCAALEEAIKACDDQRDDFLSEQYAVGQPMSSFSERFACGECAQAIRALIDKDAPT